nr:cuticle protein 16.8-like [Rhipicephalus microplus]
MFSKVLLCCVLALSAAQQPSLDGPPQPYSFSYDNTDEFGTRISHTETGDENNNKVGSYSYTDAQGISRTVKYTADADGFHVVVETNEPGTTSSNPAAAQYVSNAAEVAPAPVAVKASPVVQAVKATPVVHAFHAAPVAVQAVKATPVVHAVHTAPVAVHAVKATPVVHAVHAAPVAVHAVHPAPTFTFNAAPVAVHHVTPVTVAARPVAFRAPLTYTLGRAKSR